MLASLADHFLGQARREPDAPALIWHGERITYGELRDMARRALSQLEKLDLPERGPVGILAKKSPQAIALIVACLTVRRPVLLPSVDLGAETLRKLFAEAGCSHVLSPQGDRPTVTGELVHSEDGRPPPRSPATGRAPLMLTTSGSTGVPKVVPLSHRALDRFTDWAATRFDIRAGRTVLNYAPLNFDLCLLDIWTTLKYGGCVALVDQDRATNAGYLLELLTASEVHVVQAVPMLYRLLIDAAGDRGYRLASVAHVVITGDSVSLSSLRALPALFPRARFYNVYGCTETNDSFIYEIDISRVRTLGQLPIGEPLPGVRALIVSNDDDQVVEGAGSGELLVSTPFQTHGYLVEALSDGKFVSHPEGLDRRTYFRTGDIVHRYGDGSITLVGRTDGYVKIRGVRVSTHAVEQVILGQDEVVEVAVVPIPDELAGHRLHAVVRRDEARELNSLSLRQHCARSLDRAAIPSTMEIVTAPLPKTSTGKVDRQRALSTTRGADSSD